MNAAASKFLRIGELARRTGTSVPTIRFYEQQGLLAAARRLDSGQRVYGADDVSTVQFIRRARAFEFSLPTIARLLDLRHDTHCTCDGLLAFGQQQLQQMRDKLESLRALEQELSALVTACQSSCHGGPISDCTITLHLDAPAKLATARPSTPPV